MLGNTLHRTTAQVPCDLGSQSQNTFAEPSTLHEVTVEKTGTQSPNSLGAAEKRHGTLRNTYLKLCQEHTDVDEDLILALVTKAMNDTVGPRGLVPSAHVFGEFPSLRSYLGANIPMHTLAERAIIAQKIRKLMSKHMAVAEIKTALNKRTPAAAELT